MSQPTQGVVFRDRPDETSLCFRKVRRDYPALPACKALDYIKNSMGESVQEFFCRHDWAINEESDRSYCLNCGADGDA